MWKKFDKFLKGGVDTHAGGGGGGGQHSDGFEQMVSPRLNTMPTPRGGGGSGLAGGRPSRIVDKGKEDEEIAKTFALEKAKLERKQQMTKDASSNNGTSASPASEVSSERNVCEIDLEDVVLDSPATREKMRFLQWKADNLAKSIRHLIKVSRQIQSDGEALTGSYNLFSDALHDLASNASADHHNMLEIGLRKFGDAVFELNEFRNVLMMQVDSVFTNPMQEFLEKDLKETKEQSKKLDRLRSQYDNMATKVAGIRDDSKLVPAFRELEYLRRQYEMTSLEYVFNLNNVQSKKSIVFLERVCAMMFAELARYHQAYVLCQENQPYMRQLTEHLQVVREQFESEAEAVKERKLALSTESAVQKQRVTFTGVSEVEGYLMKRSTNLLKDWQRRFFVARNGRLYKCRKIRPGMAREWEHAERMARSEVEQPNKLFDGDGAGANGGGGDGDGGREGASGVGGGDDSGDGDRMVSGGGGDSGSGSTTGPATGEGGFTHTVLVDLILCTVKSVDDLDRKFCFEVVSPRRTITLQAGSEMEKRMWMEILTNCITEQLNSGRSYKEEATDALDAKGGSNKNGGGSNGGGGGNSPSERDRKNEIRRRTLKLVMQSDTGNAVCAECGAPKPVWASINLGITLCIDCSGIHRSLGTHVSKVRSLTLDTWDTESVRVMIALGNTRVRDVMEKERSEKEFRKPTPGTSRGDMETYIKAKYVQKLWVKRPDNGAADPQTRFFEAAKSCDLAKLFEALAQGADPSQPNTDDQNYTALHYAAINDHIAGAELLIQSGADVNPLDKKCWTPLHHCAFTNQTRCAALLFRRGARIDFCNADGDLPLDLAVNHRQADCVTLLRLAKLAMEEHPGNALNDESFAHALKTFSDQITTPIEDGTSGTSTPILPSESADSPFESYGFDAEEIPAAMAALASKIDQEDVGPESGDDDLDDDTDVVPNLSMPPSTKKNGGGAVSRDVSRKNQSPVNQPDPPASSSSRPSPASASSPTSSPAPSLSSPSPPRVPTSPRPQSPPSSTPKLELTRPSSPPSVSTSSARDKDKFGRKRPMTARPSSQSSPPPVRFDSKNNNSLGDIDVIPSNVSPKLKRDFGLTRTKLRSHSHGAPPMIISPTDQPTDQETES